MRGHWGPELKGNVEPHSLIPSLSVSSHVVRCFTLLNAPTMICFLGTGTKATGSTDHGRNFWNSKLKPFFFFQLNISGICSSNGNSSTQLILPSLQWDKVKFNLKIYPFKAPQRILLSISSKCYFPSQMKEKSK